MIKKNLIRVFYFYRDGFREMTWGRVLWAIILIKLFVMFFVLKLFFPFLPGRKDGGREAGLCGTGVDKPDGRITIPYLY